MATLTVQQLSAGGANPTTLNAVSTSDEFVNDGQTIGTVFNGSGGNLTVTVVTPQTIRGAGEDLDVQDLTYVVSNGDTLTIPPLKKTTFNDVNGNVTINFDVQASVTVSLVSVANAL